MKRPHFLIRDFIDKYGKPLGLTFNSAQKGLDRRITVPEVERPGLSLAGYSQRRVYKRILLFGRIELEYLRDLSSDMRIKRLREVITKDNPAVIISRGLSAPKELIQLCHEQGIPILRSEHKSMVLLTKINLVLSEEFSPLVSLHGTLVEVFGVGVLIEGDSSIGKSEAALGLIERGHRLVSDDVVHIRRKNNQLLEGSGPELTRHMLEVRGIGILNVAHLYGAVSVRQNVQVDVAIQLEEWNDTHFYDRVGLEERFKEILEVRLPSYTLPVKPGRDIVLLFETTILNHRLKEMGYHSAKDFNIKLLEEIARRQGKARHGR